MKKSNTATTEATGTTTGPLQTIALPPDLARTLESILKEETRRRGPGSKAPTPADCVAAYCLLYAVDRETAVDAVDAVIDHSGLHGYTSP